MKKIFAIILCSLFLFSGGLDARDGKKKPQSDKAREKAMKKMEKKNQKEQEAFFKKKHKSEVRKGKHSGGIGNSYESVTGKKKK